MSKQLSVPENDILRKYRIAALTTPIAAYEMTNLDKAMSDILIKKDIPREKKLKLYYETLNNFIDVRDIYLQKGVSDIMDTSDSSSHPNFSSSSVLPTFSSLSSSSPLSRTPAAASSPISMLQETIREKEEEKEEKEEEEKEKSGETSGANEQKKKKRLSLASVLSSKIQKKKFPTRLMIEKKSRKKKEKQKYLQFC